uniref:Transmembrane protein n=1 Tax=Ditylum brightwellii TaxID=49249 RepID=A0A6U3RN36_9STRA|mmetsp:Transcript_27423/g.40761  ORF Transcript_27423/g.40761 Transcript_27423/m.40761 type:complete len:328 (+) Transcript_27423:195-1178(+)
MLNKKSNSRDEDCEAQAAEARRQGTELIEDHFAHHVQHNPDSSYVSWIACLHPENAEVTIDERFFVPGNPWWTVYEGAKGEIPTATAESLEGAPTAVATANTPTSTTPPEDVSKSSSGLDLVVGSLLSVIGILTVFGLEAAAYAIYCVSAAFYRLSEAMDPPTTVTGIFYSICLLVYYLLALLDSCLLVASVLTTEIMAGALFLLSCLFAGCEMAASWHQYLRRTCHLLRWAFRSESLSAHPPRHLCLVCLPKEKLREDKKGEEDIEEPPTWARIEPSVPKEDWVEAGSSATPTAPEEHVIVLDQSNVIVENDGKDNSASQGKLDTW